MGLAPFLAALEDAGRVLVRSDPDRSFADPDAGGPEPDDPGLDAALLALAARVRADLAHEPPPVSLAVARWATRLVWAACQGLAHRALPPDALARALEAPCPAPPSPTTALSADLTLSVLPDLLRLGAGLPADDALRVHLARLARTWPLSSVGAPLGPGPFDVQAFVDDAGLRALYVDRILLRGDTTRLGHPRVDEALREALGGLPWLAPSVAAALCAAPTAAHTPSQVTP